MCCARPPISLCTTYDFFFRYYENNFHVLNFGFYFFLISGFALWADGFKNIAIFDLIFGGILAGATFLYPFGNAAQVVSYAFCLHKKLINRHEPNSFSFRANVGWAIPRLPHRLFCRWGIKCKDSSLHRHECNLPGNHPPWQRYFRKQNAMGSFLLYRSEFGLHCIA